MYRAGVLTVSDSAAAGTADDRGGPLLCGLLREAGLEVAEHRVVPDEAPAISAQLVDWCDRLRLDLVVTTGGTGLSPRDVTPEATRPLLEREIPGIAEAMRAAGLRATPRSMLSRAVAGVRGRTLVVNLPGSPGAIRDGMAVLAPVLEHAIAKIQGDPSPCTPRGVSPVGRGPSAEEAP